MIILQTIALLIVATALVGLALSVLVLVAAYKLFEKAGVEGWKAIVPFYNLYVLTVDIAKLDVIWFALLFAAFIPIIGWLIAIVASLNISYATVRRFIKDKDMHIVGTILFGIFVVIIAFGNYSYGDTLQVPTYNNLSSTDQAKCASALIRLSFDPNVIVVDVTSDFYEDAYSYTTRTINGKDYINSITFGVDRASSISIRFYKAVASNNYTYPYTNPTSIINFEVLL